MTRRHYGGPFAAWLKRFLETLADDADLVAAVIARDGAGHSVEYLANGPVCDATTLFAAVCECGWDTAPFTDIDALMVAVWMHRAGDDHADAVFDAAGFTIDADALR